MHAVLPLVLLIVASVCWKGGVSRLSPDGQRRRADPAAADAHPWYLQPTSYTPAAVLLLVLTAACAVAALVVAIGGWTR